LLDESLTLFETVGDRQGLVYCLEGHAALATAQGHAERAVGLAAAAMAARAVLGTVVSPAGQARSPAGQNRLRRALEPARVALTEAAYADAWAGGETMTLEQAITSARAPVDGRPTEPESRAGEAGSG